MEIVFELTLTLFVLSAESTPNYYAIQKKKGVSKWIKFGIPVAVIALVGAGVGAYFGLRNKSNNNASANGNSQGNNNGNGNSNNNGGSSFNLDDSRLAFSTDTWMLPVYPSTVSD